MRILTLGAPAEGVVYEKRNAVRCLIVNNDQICIIHVKKGMYDIRRKSPTTTSHTLMTGNYYKLPGGGIEPEDPNDTIACQREALEETGCEVDVRPELIAQVTEYRGTLHQESRAYICTVRQDTGKVELTNLEASEVWLIFGVQSPKLSRKWEMLRRLMSSASSSRSETSFSLRPICRRET